MKRFLLFLSFVVSHLSFSSVAAQSSPEADPNFYIYLCFGQSNMEGNAQPETVDKQNVDARFLMLATCDFSSPKRTTGEWYKATPPIVNPWGGLGMADYFGRTMVAALPTNVKVGVVDVAIGGIAIEGFMPDKIAGILAKAEAWQAERIRAYGSNPYQRLVDMGKKAQEVGIIKGVLLHQGCSNNGDPNWPNNVKKIYNNMLSDLGLSADSVPLFAGETLRQDQGGSCYAHNTQVNRLPEVIPTAHVISSLGCPGNGVDPWHFNNVGYRVIGKRYAYAALQTMGLETKVNPDYQMPDALRRFYAVREIDKINDLKIAAGYSRKITTYKGTFKDNHKEDLIGETTFSSDDFQMSGNMILTTEDQNVIGIVTATYTDFMGTVWTQDITVATGTMRSIQGVEADDETLDMPVYTLLGVKVATGKEWDSLPGGLYILNGRIIRKP